MRCDFCDTDGHQSLRIVPIPVGKKISHSYTADVKAVIGYANACELCVEMINKK